LIAHPADFLRAADPCEEYPNCFSRHIIGLSEFHDTLSPSILHSGGDIGDENLRGEISLIRRRFSYFAF
jgi:hypothetical protein